MGQFFRFSIIGGLSAVSGWILLYLLVDIVGWNYLVAYAASFLAVNAASYLAAGNYAFRVGNDRSRGGLLRYYLINVASLALNGLALAAMVERLGLNYLVAAILLTALNAPINFLLHRRLTYRVGMRKSGAA